MKHNRYLNVIMYYVLGCTNSIFMDSWCILHISFIPPGSDYSHIISEGLYILNKAFLLPSPLQKKLDDTLSYRLRLAIPRPPPLLIQFNPGPFLLQKIIVPLNIFWELYILSINLTFENIFSNICLFAKKLPLAHQLSTHLERFIYQL